MLVHAGFNLQEPVLLNIPTNTAKHDKVAQTYPPQNAADPLRILAEVCETR